MKEIKLSVGELAEFSRSGDINFRFSGKSSALEGIRGHQLVQSSRGSAYKAEQTLSRRIEFKHYAITINGRADGIDQSYCPPLLEEIKTLRVPITALPGDVHTIHSVQLQLYGHLFAEVSNDKQVLLRRCYFNLDSQEQTLIDELANSVELAVLFNEKLQAYVDWLDQRRAWKDLRDRSIKDMTFPYSEFRVGQRDLSVAVYRNCMQGEQMVLQAPTGIGKTMATIFPALKAMGSEDQDQLFYLSAKTSGQLSAEASIADLSDVELRTVILTAKDKVCFTPGAPCHPDHCEFAKGYYDRVREGVKQVFASDRMVRRERLEFWARKYALCPFELSLDLARQADVIICDYNYVFDPSVYLRHFFSSGSSSKYTLLIDESHNLVDRGREMFSAALSKSSFLSIKKSLASNDLLLARQLDGVNRQILTIRNKERDIFDKNGILQLTEISRGFIRSLRRFCDSAEEALQAQHQQPLLSLYFECLRFLRTLENAEEGRQQLETDSVVTDMTNFDLCPQPRPDRNYAYLLKQVDRDIQIQLFCVNPASQLKIGFDRMANVVCFSATMQPQQYFKTLLGTSDDATWYKVSSPFPKEHLGVFVASEVATNYRQRHKSIDALVQLILSVVAQKRGNYMVFFPSYDYLDAVYERMSSSPFMLVRQTRQMCDEQREDFLSRFSSKNEDSLVGFAVMGGVFAEGVDLKGDRLIGAIVVGVGLPQIGIERDLIKTHFGERGFAFAYQYPGMNRVLQTAGRVIRDVQDRGIVVLVDPRFCERRYRELMPDDWHPEESNSTKQLIYQLDVFWRTTA
jgi:DNA excision repair protein ERCC-2